MKKILSILAILFFITGCVQKKDAYYYKDMSQTVISLFKDLNYDKKEYSNKENEAINKIINELTHEEHKINVSEFIEEKEEYRVYESNTPEIFKEEDTCYIYYDDLDFEEYENDLNDYEMEPHKRVVCDGYYTILYYSYFYPKYEVTQTDPKHDYIFIDFNETNKGYNYIYKSSYDGEYLIVDIDTKNLEIKLLNTVQEEDIIIEEDNKINLLSVFLIILVIIISIGTIIVLIKKSKQEEY